jgi:hypothetical protein
MSEGNKKDPAARMRELLSGGKSALVTRLPKKSGNVVSSLPQQEGQPEKQDALKVTNPTFKKKTAPQISPRPAPSAKDGKYKFGPPFWTIASIFSITVNVILVIFLIVVMTSIGKFNMGSALNIGNSVLGGLYTNFEKMDRAHITSTIPVQTTIPVKFDLQLNQQTNVVLSQDVTINNARVTVNTGGLNITNALTTIVLPQGTTLPIVLNLTVPVDTTVPVVLNVNVDIPLNQTQLHEPFSGLQDVVKPYYCMISPNALNLNGQPVCR